MAYWKQEETFHISKYPCIILSIINTTLITKLSNFPKIFENSPNTLGCLYIFRRLPKNSEEDPKMFRLWIKTFYLVWSSLFTVKIKLIFYVRRDTIFPRRRNPCISLSLYHFTCFASKTYKYFMTRTQRESLPWRRFG